MTCIAVRPATQGTVPPMVPGKAKGFTYLGLLLLIAIGGIGLAVVGQVWHTDAQREREKELLFIGEQYAKAIDSYFESTPSGPRQYPASLQDLLRDIRFPAIKRHLRKLYRDPITGSEEWGLVLEQGRIVGIYSTSYARPIKQDGFTDNFATFSKAESYRGWQFMHPGVAGAASQPVAAIDQPLASGPVATTSTTQTSATTPASASAPVTPVTAFPKSDRTADTEACQSTLAGENAQCRSRCGNPAGAECRSCFATAFSSYRSCLHGS